MRELLFGLALEPSVTQFYFISFRFGDATQNKPGKVAVKDSQLHHVQVKREWQVSLLVPSFSVPTVPKPPMPYIDKLVVMDICIDFERDS